jgi:endonuclease/exonuclease/phosphatase family metal-dependent hydrolase
MTRGVARFLTLNLWGENGPWEARLELLQARLEAIAPDVIGLQEVRDVPGRVPNQAAALAGPRGWHHAFAPTTTTSSGQEGLGIVSRFPIGAQEFSHLPGSTEAEGRGILSARLDGEAGGMWVHSTHLAYREHEGLMREAQVQFVDEVLANHDNGNLRVALGDFNAVPESDEIRFLTGQHTLGGRRVAYQDAWVAVNQDRPGYTWSRANDYTERMHWLRRDRRLDYIFVSPVRRDRRAVVHGAAVVLDAPETGSGGKRLFVSDHFGVTADIQILAQSEGT